LNAAVALLVAYALAGVYAAASWFWAPPGTLGLALDYGSSVRKVQSGSPAELAGIVPGDHVLLGSIAYEQRRYVAGAEPGAPAGTRIHFRVIHGGAARDVTLTAVPVELMQADRFSLLLQCVSALVFIAVGAGLMILRPSLATWGFGLYCLLILPTANHPALLETANATVGAYFVYDVIQNLGIVGLVVFALEFPRRFPSLWRDRVRRSLPGLFAVLAAMTLYPDIANLVYGRGAHFENEMLQIVFGLTFALALSILIDTYRRVAPDERERLRWVLIGFGLGLAVTYVGNTLVFSSLIPIDPPSWLVNVSITLNVLLPLTVAHAVIRHRVLDINFVVSRALVYALLTTVLAALFGLLDFVFGHMLEEFRLSRFVQAGISISIAFAFDTLHKRTENFIETIFFRKRRAAQARLTRLTTELPLARSAQVIEKALIDEAIDALTLTSAAVFRNIEGSGFKRTAAHGWRAGDCDVFDDSDLLVLELRARKRALTLSELAFHHVGLPPAGQAPILAIPLQSRTDQLTGIVLYGGHPSGGDVDPDEAELLETLAHAAGIAFDGLESERLRAANEVQDDTIADLKARLDELRRLAPALSPVPQA
jgi:hypothetical protein